MGAKCPTCGGRENVIVDGTSCQVRPDRFHREAREKFDREAAATPPAPTPADDESGAEAMRLAAALDKVAKAAGYERAWVAPSGEPNIILERKHPTSEGMIQVTRLDLCVGAPDDARDPLTKMTFAEMRCALFSARERLAILDNERVLAGRRPADDASGALMPKDVPGAAEFRDAFKAAVPPRGADHASWVNGYCAGWIACEKALPLPARDDAVEEARKAFYEAAREWFALDYAAKRPPFPNPGQCEWSRVWGNLSDTYVLMMRAEQGAKGGA